MQVGRKWILSMIASCLAFVNELERQEISYCNAAKNCSDLPFAVYFNHFYLMFTSFFHFPSRAWNKFDSSLVPTEDEFFSNFLHLNCCSHIIRKFSLCCLKSVMLSLLLDVMAFLCIKFILFSKEWYQCLFSSTGPPYSANINLLQVHKIPPATDMAILADMGSPPCLTFFRHSCNFRSRSLTSKTFLPLILAGWSLISPWLPSSFLLLLLLRSSS